MSRAVKSDPVPTSISLGKSDPDLKKSVLINKKKKKYTKKQDIFFSHYIKKGVKSIHE